jgi:hypothetical protein
VCPRGEFHIAHHIRFLNAGAATQKFSVSRTKDASS